MKFFLFIFLFFILNGIQAVDWWVSPDGTGDGTSSSSPLGSIFDAISNANAGDTIKLLEGTYDFNPSPSIIPKQNMIIEGIGNVYLFRNSTGAATSSFFRIETTGVVLENLRVSDAGTAGFGDFPILNILASSSLTVRKSSFKSPSSSTRDLYFIVNAGSLTVEDSKFEKVTSIDANPDPIRISSSSTSSFQRCVFSKINANHLFNIQTSATVTIQDSFFREVGLGTNQRIIRIPNKNSITLSLQNNTFSRNGQTVNCDAAGAFSSFTQAQNLFCETNPSTFSANCGSFSPVTLDPPGCICTGGGAGFKDCDGNCFGENYNCVNEDIYVSATIGNDATGNGTFSNPFQTIQKGIDTATYGDTVVVLPGTYDIVSSPILQNKNIQIRSTDVHKTFVNCDGRIDGSLSAPQSWRVETIDTYGLDQDAIIQGFTFQNGGTCILINRASPLIEDCIFDSNFAREEFSFSAFRVAGSILARSVTPVGFTPPPTPPPTPPIFPIVRNCLFKDSPLTNLNAPVIYLNYRDITSFLPPFGGFFTVESSKFYNNNRGLVAVDWTCPSNCKTDDYGLVLKDNIFSISFSPTGTVPFSGAITLKGPDTINYLIATNNSFFNHTTASASYQQTIHCTNNYAAASQGSNNRICTDDGDSTLSNQISTNCGTAITDLGFVQLSFGGGPDSCGVCPAPEISTRDCDGECFGSKVEGSSGGCCFENELDCANECDGLNYVDEGGCCTEEERDCFGDCHGTAVFDNTTCCNATDADCENICFGEKEFDSLGDCCLPENKTNCNICFATPDCTPAPTPPLPSPTTTTTPASQKNDNLLDLSLGVIIGIAVGGFFILVLLGIVIYLCIKKRKAYHHEKSGTVELDYTSHSNK